MSETYDVNRQSIVDALAAYVKYTPRAGIIDGISEAFIDRLAADSVTAKVKLRSILSRCAGWDENLQAVVVSGNKTRNPDNRRIEHLINQIMEPLFDGRLTGEIRAAAKWFTEPKNETLLAALKRVAPKAWHAGRKPSRIFNDFAKVIGVFNEATGSRYQRLFAKLSDEMKATATPYKLYISINPAHFLTASNPYKDSRGELLVSCYSLNWIKSMHNTAGIVGYARDECALIVFTAAGEGEGLFNRKTTRQFFFVNAGVVIQGCLCDPHGNARTETSARYREQVQRVISEGLARENTWLTCNYVGNRYGVHARQHPDFGGYRDWEHFDDETAMLSIQADEPKISGDFVVGAAGLCIECAKELHGDEWKCESCSGKIRKG